MATSAQAKAFIQQIAPLIQKYSKQYGYQVASPIIAQACIESAYGTSSLGKKYHNYFGMKCGSSWKGKSVNLSTKEEYTVGTLTSIKANFRVYDSMEEGVKGYFDFINRSRYANLKTARAAKEYLELIKADGYATSSTYVNTNMNVVNKYDLTKYDGESTPIYITNPYAEPNLIITSKANAAERKTKYFLYEGEGVKWVQYELNKKGYSLEVDGKCGKLTLAAIKDFQTRAGLVVDGLCGSATRWELKVR